MDGSKLQAKVNKGFRISAAKVGLVYEHYRPAGTSLPLDASNRLPDMMAAFEPSQFAFRAPKRDETPFWSVLLDGDLAQPGDYLVRDGATWFVAEMAALLPIRAVQCSTVVSIRRPTASTAVGVLPYGGDVAGDEGVLADGWPAGFTLDGRGERTDIKLPSDGRFGSFALYLPSSLPVTLHADDILQDASGMRMLVTAVAPSHGAVKVLVQQVTV